MEETIITRVSVPAMDSLLGVRFPVLDKGHVRVVDYMGGDEAIVQAARISYGKGTKTLSEDEGLIRYLLRHSHTTPFEMCELKLHIRMPMDAWRQHIRHRTASVNEYSTRYSEAIDDKQIASGWRPQSTTNKQGSGDNGLDWPEHEDNTVLVCGTRYILDQEHMEKPQISAGMDGIKEVFIPVGWTLGNYLTYREENFHIFSEGVYQERLALGVAKEQARKDLPLSTYTEAYWKINLHNLLHYLSLRMDKHAQLEIRQYANVIGHIVESWCPITWKAFNDYNLRRDAMLLTAKDKVIIRFLCEGSAIMANEYATVYGWLHRKEDGTLKLNRERTECEEKLTTLNLVVPWR